MKRTHITIYPNDETIFGPEFVCLLHCHKTTTFPIGYSRRGPISIAAAAVNTDSCTQSHAHTHTYVEEQRQ